MALTASKVVASVLNMAYCYLIFRIFKAGWIFLMDKCCHLTSVGASLGSSVLCVNQKGLHQPHLYALFIFSVGLRWVGLVTTEIISMNSTGCSSSNQETSHKWGYEGYESLSEGKWKQRKKGKKPLIRFLVQLKLLLKCYRIGHWIPVRLPLAF